jgi:hypothetical protein
MSIPAGAWDKSLAWRDLSNLARRVFVDRNARGMPIKDRDKIKAEARPELRQAIAHVRKARNALRAGDRARYEHMRDVARFHVVRALLDFQQPYMSARAQATDRLAATGESGARATAEKYARPELEELIRGHIERSETMPVEAWVEEYGLSRSAIYRRIASIKNG